VIATPAQETRIEATLTALAGVERACAGALEPAILALCRNRISLLLGSECLPDSGVAAPPPDVRDKLAALPQWTSSPLFTDAERACLSFTEQFVIGVALIDNAAVAALLEHLTPGDTYVFVRWLQACEAAQRVALLLRHDDHLRALCATAFGSGVTSR
jgi:hypothetical protein